MTLQDWFNYFKEDGDIEEAFDVIREEESSDLYFYYDCLLNDIRRKLLTDKIVICFDAYDEEMAKRSILPESMIKHKEITGCSWETLLIFCKFILDKERDCTCVFVPYKKDDEDDEEVWECYIYSRNENRAIDEIYESFYSEILRDICIGDYSDKEFEQYINDKCNPGGKRIYDLFKKDYELIYHYGILNNLKNIQSISFKTWYSIFRFDIKEDSDNKIRIQFFNDIADEIIDFMFKKGKEIILNINEGTVNVNNSPLRFYILSKEIYRVNQEIEEESGYSDLFGYNYIKIASELIDYAIRRADASDIIEMVRTEETITYRIKIISDLVEMARKDKVVIFDDDGDEEECLNKSIIPESLRTFIHKVDGDIYNAWNLCDNYLINEPGILNVSLYNSKNDEMDTYLTYSSDEKHVLDNLKQSVVMKTIIKTIKNYKEIDNCRGEGAYRELNKSMTLTMDGIDNYQDDNKVEVDMLVDYYLEIMRVYHVFEMKNDITKAARKFKDHITVIKMLGTEERIRFYMIICDTVIDFFTKENSLTLYTDGRNLDEIKIPMGIYLFLDDFKQNLKFIRGIVDFAIERAGIQDLFEITETEDSITYKNKLIQ